MSKQTIVAIALFALGILPACSSFPKGEASCRISAKGACPEISNQTFFVRTGGTISYYNPDGTIRSLESTQVRKGTWWVDKAGTHLITEWPFAGTMQPAPIASLNEYAENFNGDPAGVKLNNRGFYIVPYDERPFSMIAKLARAR